MLRFLREGNRHTKTIWWVLIIVTVVTFVGGFVVLFGLDIGSRRAGQGGGNFVATIGGDRITREEYQNAINQQRDQYKQQFGNDPADRDEKMLESQAWRQLLTEHLLSSEARRAGITAHDAQVEFMLKYSPPTVLAQQPVFQTNGKFDPQKYQAALRDPSINWSPFEALVRQQLPARLLQERMLSSVKLSQPELNAAYRDREEKLNGVVVQVPPDQNAKVPAPTPADLDRVYQKYQGRFRAGDRVNLEVLTLPKTASDDDKRQARVLAQGITDRARKGEDFATLAKDYSEGPGAQQGGVLPQTYHASELGPELGPHLATLKVGDITDPIPQPGRYLVIKLLDRVNQPSADDPGLKVAQISIMVHPNDNALHDQFQKLQDIRDRGAKLHDLGRAAVEKGMTTQKTGFFDANGTPPTLYAEPDAADWGLNAKKGEVSPVFEGPDAFVVVQVDDKHAAGTMSRDEIEPTLRQLAELDARLTLSKPKADQIAQALQHGQTLEQAAQAAGLAAQPIKDLTRAQADPRLSSSPEVVGAMFGSPVGKTIGPMRTVNNWTFARVDNRVEPNPAAYDSVAGQVRMAVIQRKQQSFFAGWLNDLRAKAKVRDLRSAQ